MGHAFTFPTARAARPAGIPGCWLAVVVDGVAQLFFVLQTPCRCQSHAVQRLVRHRNMANPVCSRSAKSRIFPAAQPPAAQIDAAVYDIGRQSGGVALQARSSLGPRRLPANRLGQRFAICLGHFDLFGLRRSTGRVPRDMH